MSIISYILIGLIAFFALIFLFTELFFRTSDVSTRKYIFNTLFVFIIIFIGGLIFTYIIDYINHGKVADGKYSIYDIVWIIIGSLAGLLLLEFIFRFIINYITEQKSERSMAIYYVYIIFMSLVYIPIYFISINDKQKETLMWGTIPVFVLSLVAHFSQKLPDSLKDIALVLFGFVLFVYLSILAIFISKNVNKGLSYFDNFLVI